MQRDRKAEFVGRAADEEFLRDLILVHCGVLAQSILTLHLPLSDVPSAALPDLCAEAVSAAEGFKRSLHRRN